MSAQNHKDKVTIRIQRYNPDTDENPYFEEFQVGRMPGKTVLDALLEIKGEQDGSLTFRRSCRHGICGSCAMNVNGTNKLACESTLEDHTNKDGLITIRPLSYVPVVKDLVTDRGSFWDQYLRIKPWLIPPEEVPEKEFRIPPEEVSTLGNAERCIMCGVCYSACPVISVNQKFLGPHALLKAFLRVSDTRDKAPDEHLEEIATVWDCTTCYMCDSQCPKDLDPGQVSKTLRSMQVEKGSVPRTIGTALTSTFRYKNPFEMAHAKRLEWAEGLSLLNVQEESVDALYFVCCIACYDPRAQKIPQAMVAAMDSAGVRLGTLGSEEACCGSDVRRMGEVGLYEMMVEEQTETLKAAGPQQIVTTSPHCFDAYKNHYPDLEFKTEHYTQFVARLIADGRLAFKRKLKKRVTYHDPCYLGIQNNVFEEPRAILRSIPGVELVEMERSAEKSLCCGGGGGRMWFEGHDTEVHLAHERMHEAIATGAQILATACPFCLNMLDAAAKSVALDDQIEVKDIMELVVDAIEP
ncbi:MAG: succinate dehydrogenase iron-sulfur subunit [Anaerolineales bacterium]|nr:succinate dehydrogenase iron-sulfur subunit [Anaerolineales bacterium]